MYIYIYIYIHIYIFIYICVYIYMYIYIYTCKCTLHKNSNHLGRRNIVLWVSQRFHCAQRWNRKQPANSMAYFKKLKNG